ncbi:hypothetical protein [Halarcobacter sp.]|nr:hypothetical protein [Halarcobacter sp.]
MYLDDVQVMVAVIVLVMLGVVFNEIVRWLVTKPNSKKIGFDNKLERVKK